MNVQTVTVPANNLYGNRQSKKSDGTVPEFVIQPIGEQQTDSPAVSNDNAVDPLSAMESMTGKTAANEPGYSVTDEEAEYFREKYGDTYNEETAYQLYYELADKGIISENDACGSSGVLAIRPLYDFDGILYGGVGKANLRAGDRVFVKDVSRTDENAYKREWERFKSEYDREITTWEDAVQESIDFERYLKDNSDGRDLASQWHFDKVAEDLEKVKNVIFQIFG